MANDIKNNCKRIGAIIKMADYGHNRYLSLTVMLQGVTHVTTKAYSGGATLISADSYPYLTLEYVDGRKYKQPITLGN